MIKARPYMKYESELDHGFAGEVESKPGGEGIRKCIQCGTCSGGCPLSPYMDYTPRQVMNMIREGFKEDVLRSGTIWICTSCYTCTVDCPRQIKITDVMYTLKRMAIENETYAKNLPTPVLAKVFFDIVQRKGRNSEAELLRKVGMKTGMLRLTKKLGFGFRLYRKGRLSLRGESISDPSVISRMLEAATAKEEV
jgi:heterodisulfide reductase subunit C